jgi:hypothetical protein
MSPNDFKPGTATATGEAVCEAVLRFLWRQWSQLGVSGAVSGRDPWMLDPEALLLFTLHAGRFDPRLFDEVLDWCHRHSGSLSVQRLKNLMNAEADGLDRETGEELRRSVSAVAGVLTSRSSGARFRVLAPPLRGVEETESEAKPFFLEPNGCPLPHFGASDPDFRRAGWLRSPVALRGLSVTPPLETAPNLLLLRLRSLFGLSPRAETIAYLLTHPMGGVREIARAARYSPAALHETLTSLAQGGYLLVSGRGMYALKADRWQTFLNSSVPLWVDWARVLPVIAAALSALTDPARKTRSPYLTASRLVRLHDALRDALFGSGLPNPFADPVTLETVSEELPRRLLTHLDNRAS